MANTPRLGIRLLEGTDVANYELINTILQLIDTLVAKQEALAVAGGHTHNGTDGSGPKIPYANVTGGPTSLPANGGDAATVGGKQASDFAAAGHNHDAAYLGKTAQAADAAKLGGNLPAAFAPAGHTHSKSAITDFPTSMPASDVSAWAKAATKPAYNAGEVGAAPASHSHDAATQALAGFLSALDKQALDLVVSRVDQAVKSTSSPTFNVVTANKVIGAVYA